MLEVRLLGQFEVLLDGSRLSIPTRNAQSLFAYLILNAGQAHRRERLAGLLWPDSSEENARSNLRHELWRLRKALQPANNSYLISDDLTIAFDPRDEYSLDVHRFEAKPVEDSNSEDLSTALSAYQGELLPGFYEEWVFPERERLHALFEAKIARLLEILQNEGRWGEVLEWGMRWTGLGGWPEPAYRAMIAAHANRGDLSKAVGVYERLSQGLQKDLGVKPSEQTQALYKRLKSGWRVDAGQAASPEGARPPETPPVTDTHAVPWPKVRRTNIPKPLTSFIGREKEIHQVEELLTQSRLVTITGSGGVGKTRLAIQVAGSLAAGFRDGVWWVELAPLIEAVPSRRSERSSLPESMTVPGQDEQPGIDLVAQAVAKALRVPDRPGLTLSEGLLEYLGERQLLLVLDNCEHLVKACAILAAELLAGCPGVTILTTSREPVGVPGERAWYLPSLSLPETRTNLDTRAVLQSESVRLFVKRVGDILPGYQPGDEEWLTIAEICLQLDGIPLAIELAAARMNLLSSQEIAARLDRRFSLLTAGHRTALPRHQTLLAAIDWSYELLDEPERTLFRRLSVFAGSFSLEGAEAICAGEGIAPDEILTVLGRLLDKSLISVEPQPAGWDLPTRYRLLETIRSFGDLKLAEAGETDRLRDRHATYYVQLVEAAEPELLLENQGRWYRLLLAEDDNLRAVVEWTAEKDNAEIALRMVGSLLWFWWSHGSSRAGLDLALKALGLPSAALVNRYRSRANNTAAYLYWVLGDNASAREKIDQALAILDAENDEVTRGWSMQFLGLVLTSEGEYDLANEAMLEGLTIAWKAGDPQNSSFSLAFRGDIAIQKGDHLRAQIIYEESAALLQDLGNKLFQAYPKRRLGYLALERDEIQSAWELFRESLELNHEGGDQRGVIASIISLAALANHLDHPYLATQLYGWVESQLESRGISLLVLDQAEKDRLRSQLVARLDEATFASAYAEGWELSEEQAMDLASRIFGRQG